MSEENESNIYPGCIGIDLGTTYSCVAVWEGDGVKVITNEIGNRTTPSWIAFTDTERLVGDSAKSQATMNPENTLFDIKRIIGKKYSDDSVQDDLDNYPFTISPDVNDLPMIEVQYKGETKKFRPEEISAMVLSKMKEIAEDYLGKKVKNAVITVPAYFNDFQRNATKNAATIAGLNCLRTINEPTAACLCYGLDKKTMEDDNPIQTVLIYDLGGGTLDVSVLSITAGVFEVLATSGNTHLGGEDFDQALVDWYIKIFQTKYPKLDPKESEKAMRKLKSACEKVKKALSVSKTANLEIDAFYDGIDVYQKITRAQFDEICHPIFKKCLTPVGQVLSDAKLSKEDIDEIVLIGGSTRIPKVQEMLKDYFNGKELNKSVNPDEAVAYGAAVQGAVLTNTDQSGKTQDILLLDVIPLSLGIETSGGIMTALIDRNSTVPINKSQVFSTVEDDQTSVLVKVYEGERKFTKDNNLLGTFELANIPKLPRGVPKIEVQFDVDSNGILNVTATELSTGQTAEVTISQDSGRLSQEEINQMIEDAETYRAEDELRKQSIDAMEAFQKYLYSIQNSVNDEELNVNLTDEEISIVNQYLLNTFVWIQENLEANKDLITQCRKQVEYNLQNYLYKIYSRKEELNNNNNTATDPTTSTSDNQSPRGQLNDIIADIVDNTLSQKDQSLEKEKVIIDNKNQSDNNNLNTTENTKDSNKDNTKGSKVLKDNDKKQTITETNNEKVRKNTIKVKRKTIIKSSKPIKKKLVVKK